MAMTNEVNNFVVEGDLAGQRLDKILVALCDDLSRSRIKALIDSGEVKLNGYICTTPSRKLARGEKIELNLPAPVAAEPAPQDIPLDIVYEDDDLIVLNKPAGMVVHPGAGNYDGTLVNALLHHCGDSLSGIGGVMRPGIVHRLDKDTSGLMVVAKHDKAHKGLAGQLEDRSLSRKYKALVLGVPVPPKGNVDLPIARHHANRLRMTVNEEKGRAAKTYYQVIERYRDEFALVECTLESGRTHQIRVHMSHIKHPLIGDQTYGPQPTAVQGALKRAQYDVDIAADIMKFSRQALQAYSLSFIHPITENTVSFEIKLPEDFSNLLKYIDN